MFLQLIWKFLKAGYMEQWTYNRTYSGVPQGAGVSPVLANVYLHEIRQNLWKNTHRNIKEITVTLADDFPQKKLVHPPAARQAGHHSRLYRLEADLLVPVPH